MKSSSVTEPCDHNMAVFFIQCSIVFVAPCTDTGLFCGMLEMSRDWYMYLLSSISPRNSSDELSKINNQTSLPEGTNPQIEIHFIVTPVENVLSMTCQLDTLAPHGN